MQVPQLDGFTTFEYPHSFRETAARNKDRPGCPVVAECAIEFPHDRGRDGLGMGLTLHDCAIAQHYIYTFISRRRGKPRMVTSVIHQGSNLDFKASTTEFVPEVHLGTNEPSIISSSCGAVPAIPT